MSLPNGPTALYRLYDPAGRLLYVGVSCSVMSRFSNHRHTKPWWTEVTTIRLEHFPDQRSALLAEKVAIQSENPLHNIAFAAERSHARPSSPATGVVLPISRASRYSGLDEAFILQLASEDRIRSCRVRGERFVAKADLDAFACTDTGTHRIAQIGLAQ